MPHNFLPLAAAAPNFFQEWPRQTKPKKGQFMNFSQGHSGTKVQCESCFFPKEKHQNSQEWPKFMNISFWPFLWFGLPGRLLILLSHKKWLQRNFPCRGKPIECTPRGACNSTLLRRVLRRFSDSKRFLEGFLEGACKSFQ